MNKGREAMRLKKRVEILENELINQYAAHKELEKMVNALANSLGKEFIGIVPEKNNWKIVDTKL